MCFVDSKTNFFYFCFLVFSVYCIIFQKLSIRSPGPVTPRDVECEGFNLTYPRIAIASSSTTSALENDVDKKVDDAINSFLLTLSQIGPELLSVSF